MPQVFKVGSYWFYFWANENESLESVHIHIKQGKPIKDATKIWITEAGGCVVCNNNSKILAHVLRNILDVITARSEEIVSKWQEFFGEKIFLLKSHLIPATEGLAHIQ